MLNERNTLLEDDGIEEEILVEEECSVAQAVWGDIQGNIENQTDLQNALDAKQDSLTEAQLNAVNSGITAEKVTTYDGYADQIASKADQSALNAESVVRGEADTALGTRIDNEALARQQADNGLQSQIDAITSQSDVVDVVANYAALQAYDTSTLSDKDVIKVLDDETHEDALTYYRWSTATQTWSYIGQEAPYYSKGQMDVMLQGKQDTLTAGANIQIENGTISATDTTYTAGNGLNLNGTEFSADTDVLATKEDLESYYTKPETDNLLAPKLEAELVAVLPSTGTEGKLYLTPKAHTTQTATGNPITATVTEQAGALESFQLDGDTFQQSYEGKNLLKMAGNWAIVQGSGVTVTDGDDGSIILNGTVVTRQDIRVYSASDRLRIESGTEVTLSRNTNNYNLIWHRFTSEESGVVSDVAYIAVNGAYSNTYTTQSTDYGFQFMLRLNVGTVFDNEKIYLQLEAGSTATSYEPFVGGQPSPSPDYPQPIQTVTGVQTVEIQGKNLFDKDNANIVRGYIAGILFNGGTDYSVFMPCEENTTYTIQKMVAQPQTANRFRINSYDKIPAAGDASISSSNFWNAGDGSDVTTHTYTTPAGAKYLGITVMTQNASGTTAIDEVLASIQVEKGSTATTYVPYSHQALPLDLGSIELCKLGTYQDYIWKDGDNWKVHKATSGNMTLNGSEDGWSKGNNGRFNLSDYAPSPAPGSADNNPILSNRFISRFSFDDLSVFLSGTNELVCFIYTSASTLTAWKAWLSSNNTTVCYAIATPTDTTITDSTLIAQLEAIRTASLQNGANIISNTATGSNLAGDMEIGYYGFAPRNRYDKWLWLDINNEYEQIGS